MSFCPKKNLSVSIFCYEEDYVRFSFVSWLQGLAQPNLTPHEGHLINTCGSTVPLLYLALVLGLFFNV